LKCTKIALNVFGHSKCLFLEGRTTPPFLCDTHFYLFFKTNKNANIVWRRNDVILTQTIKKTNKRGACPPLHKLEHIYYTIIKLAVRCKM